MSYISGYRGLMAETRLGVLKRLGRPPYALFDLSAGYGKGRLHPFLRLTNLGDARYQEIEGVAMPGRAAMGGVEWAMK